MAHDVSRAMICLTAKIGAMATTTLTYVNVPAGTVTPVKGGARSANRVREVNFLEGSPPRIL
jgi:hypothetical protein